MTTRDAATIIYSRSWTIGSPLIRHADRWGQWSHCGVVVPDGRVIEARAFHGVVATPRRDFDKRASSQEVVHITVPDLDAGLAWLDQQVGKGYDYAGILGNAFRQNWHDPERWQCAELVEAFLASCGRARFRADAWRISPNMSWSVL